ncbi:MAG: Rab family GTPase [Candidatus Thermoplasmatota archaeon]
MAEIVRKVCLCGDSAVGKTSLIRRFVTNRYDENYISTLGTTVSKKTVSIPKKRSNVTMMIWDISGQDNFKHIHASAFSNAAGTLAVCDITKPETAEHLGEWISTFHRYAKNEAPVIVLANKFDLSEAKPKSATAVHNTLKRLGFQTLSTSAKTGYNVDAVFRVLAEVIAKDEPAVTEESVKKIEMPENFPTPSALLDYLVVRFCESLGDQEMGMHMIRKQVADEGIDFRTATKEEVRRLIERFVSLAGGFKGEMDARALRAEFLKAYNRCGEE